MGGITGFEISIGAFCRYELVEGVANDQVRSEDQHYLGERYKREVLEHMSIAQLIDTIMINPTVHISPSYRYAQGLPCTWAGCSSASLDAHMVCLSVTGMSRVWRHTCCLIPAM